MASSNPPSAAGSTCPICGKPTDTHYRPFCSRRCADVDLSRWLRGAYAIPSESEPEDNQESPAAPDGDGSNDHEKH